MPDEPHDPPAPSDQQALVDELIFKRDVNEGFLLIDYISGRSEKSLKDLDTEALALPGSSLPAPGAPAVPPGAVWQAFCNIRYPPAPERYVKAENAAFVLQVKDRLNALAQPARGITIAYTTMFVGNTGWRRRTRHQQTLLDQAEGAFPNIQRHAQFFAGFFGKFLPVYLLVCFLLTAFTYWDVAYGGAIVQTLQQLEAQRTALLQSSTQTTNVPVVSPDDCKPPFPSADARQLPSICAKLEPINVQVLAARQTLQNFYEATVGRHAWYNLIAWVRPIRLGFLAYPRVDGNNDASVQSIIWVVTLFGTYVLPAMFGVLGTMAAVVRAVQAKVRDSLLSPRDFSLSLLGLLTGPLAGLAVGLFYTPSATAVQTTAGVAGTVTLTVSGLGFLAGYGADAFFKFLDALLVRVFALEEASRDR